LGAVAKGGSRPLVDVVRYAELVRSRGLVFMDSPGFDPASTTGMVAGGANLVVFSTINAGCILDGTAGEEVGSEISEMILNVASGRPTKSESQGIGDEEFVPWMIGPVL
jgi:altronate hydrolase